MPKGYSGGLPQTTYWLEVYTKQAELPVFKQQTNLDEKRNGSPNKVLIEESASTNFSTISPTSLPTKVLINGKSMLLLHNLSAEYPFFSVNTLPPGKRGAQSFGSSRLVYTLPTQSICTFLIGNSFYLITYAKNIRGTSKKIEITANTLTAERWQTG